MSKEVLDDKVKDVLAALGIEIAKRYTKSVIDEINSADGTSPEFVGLATPEIEYAFTSGVVNGMVKGYLLARQVTDDQLLDG